MVKQGHLKALERIYELGGLRLQKQLMVYMKSALQNFLNLFSAVRNLLLAFQQLTAAR